MDTSTERTWAEVSLGNLAHNLHAIRAVLPAGTKFLGIVKADAYGHGAIPVAARLAAEGADYLAVATLAEALELRAAGLTLPVLVLGHTPAEDVPALIGADLTQTVTNLAKAQEYDAAAARCGGTLRIHIKVDTGMSRLGFLCAGDRFAQGVRNIAGACRLPRLDAEGIYTHFAAADEPGPEAEAFTREQLRLFTDMLAALAAEGITFRLRHCANSGAVLRYPEAALDMVRPGILLYGYGDGEKRLGLRPCMRLMTRIGTIKHYDPGARVSYGGTWAAKKRTRVGVVPVGYADGLHRSLSGSCAFYTAGGFAPQIGRICMDMCMLDLSALPEARVGTPVEVFGEHSRLETLAEAAGTITYELLCSVSRRVPRVYVDWYGAAEQAQADRVSG